MSVSKLVELCFTHKLTLATCESMTGGLLASQIAALNAVSKIYKGSIVAYCDEIKEKVVQIDGNILEKHGAVSSMVVEHMAKNTREIFNVDCAIAISGYAGPQVMNHQGNVGLVFIAIATLKGNFVFQHQLVGNRNEIQQQACELMVDHAYTILQKLTD